MVTNNHGLQVIYKYPLTMMDNQIIQVPVGARPLSVIFQNDNAVMYCLVDCENVSITSPLHVQIVGTGQKRAHLGKYLGTFAAMNANLVFHVFYIEN